MGQPLDLDENLVKEIGFSYIISIITRINEIWVFKVGIRELENMAKAKRGRERSYMLLLY